MYGMCRLATLRLPAAAGTLRVRVMMCLALVAAERAVNLGVPIMYKHVVDTLSKASALLQLAKEHGSPYTLLLALADQVGAQPPCHWLAGPGADGLLCWNSAVLTRQHTAVHAQHPACCHDACVPVDHLSTHPCCLTAGEAASLLVRVLPLGVWLHRAVAAQGRLQ
jgi:hypothetical protein